MRTTTTPIAPPPTWCGCRARPVRGSSMGATVRSLSRSRLTRRPTAMVGACSCAAPSAVARRAGSTSRGPRSAVTSNRDRSGARMRGTGWRSNHDRRRLLPGLPLNRRRPIWALRVPRVRHALATAPRGVARVRGAWLDARRAVARLRRARSRRLARPVHRRQRLAAPGIEASPGVRVAAAVARRGARDHAASGDGARRAGGRERGDRRLNRGPVRGVVRLSDSLLARKS